MSIHLVGLIAALLAASFAASKDLCSKALASKISPTLSALTSFLFALPYYLLALIVLVSLNIPILSLGAPFYFYVLLRALSDMGAEWFRMLALKHGEISLVSGFISLSPIFLLLVSPLITGDMPTVLGAIGVCLTTCGVFILAGKSISLATARVGILYGIAAAFFFALNSCFDRLAALEAHPIVSGFWMTLVAGIFLYFASRIRRPLTPGEVTPLPLKLLFLRGGFEFLFMSVKLLALQYMQAPYVAALTKFALLITIVGGGFIFGEKDLLRRLLGGAVILCGAIMVVLGG